MGKGILGAVALLSTNQRSQKKIFEEIIIEKPPNIGKEIVIQVQDTESPKKGCHFLLQEILPTETELMSPALKMDTLW